MDSLNLKTAARRFGNAPFLIQGNTSWSFSDLSRDCPDAQWPPEASPLFVTATWTLRTLRTLLFAITQNRPVVPLHPQWATRDRTRFRKTRSRPPKTGTRWDDTTFAVMFTSGSLQSPRGVVLSRSAVIASAAGSARHLGWAPEDRWILALPVAHIGGLSILTRCLLSGKPVILLKSFSPEAVFASIRDQRATLLSVVPTMLYRLLQEDRHDLLKRLRAILVGGARIDINLLQECHNRGVTALPTYGMTETASQVATQCLEPGQEPGLLTPLQDIEICIVDETGLTLPPGTPGRIRVKGPVIMDGYLGAPPIDPRIGFTTGDRGMLTPEGKLIVHGRLDNLIISGGENIFPSDIEAVINRFSGIVDSVVFDIAHPVWGQIVAAAVHSENGRLDEAEFQRSCQQLPPFGRPRVTTVFSNFPRLAVGKVDRRQVIALARRQLHLEDVE